MQGSRAACRLWVGAGGWEVCHCWEAIQQTKRVPCIKQFLKPSPHLRHRVSELVKSVHFRLRPPDAVLVVPVSGCMKQTGSMRLGGHHTLTSAWVGCSWTGCSSLYMDMSGVRNASCVGKVSHGLRRYRPAL